MQKEFIYKVGLVLTLSLFAQYIIISNIQNWYNIIAFLPSIIGGIITIVLFVANTYFVNTPKLKMEIISINRHLSDDATISAQEIPEIVDFLDKEEKTTPKSRYSMDEVENIEFKMSSRLNELLSLIDQVKSNIPDKDKIDLGSFKKTDCEKICRSLGIYVKFESGKNSDIIDEIIDAGQSRLTDLNSNYNKLSERAAGLSIKLSQSKARLDATKAIFVISVSLINQGRVNTSIKRPAVLKVYLNQNLVVNIDLRLKDFQKKSDIPAGGSRILFFESYEISSLSADDQKVVNKFWGQAVNAQLLLEDVHSKLQKSNIVVFSEGLYERSIYDRLKDN